MFSVLRMVPDKAPNPHEHSGHDIHWALIIEIELTPQPDQPRPESTVRDYKLTNGTLALKPRAATAGYILHRWSVDCSPDHSLREPEYGLWLKDHLALYGIKNTILAPDYSVSPKAAS